MSVILRDIKVGFHQVIDSDIFAVVETGSYLPGYLQLRSIRYGHDVLTGDLPKPKTFIEQTQLFYIWQTVFHRIQEMKPNFEINDTEMSPKWKVERRDPATTVTITRNIGEKDEPPRYLILDIDTVLCFKCLHRPSVANE